MHSSNLLKLIGKLYLVEHSTKVHKTISTHYLSNDEKAMVMKKTKAVMIAALLSMCGTIVLAADEGKSSISHIQTDDLLNKVAFVAPKPAVLIEKSRPAGRIVRVVHKPLSIPAMREASTNAEKSFIYMSLKNTKTKIYYPATKKDAPIPNLFKK